MPVGILLITRRGRIIRINTAGRAIFWIPANQDLLGKPCVEFIRHEKCMTIIKRHLASGLQAETADRSEDASEPVEIFITTSTGQKRLYQMLASNIYNDANTPAATKIHDDAYVPAGTVYIFHDVTDIRHAEHMKKEFLSIIANEFEIPQGRLKRHIRTLLEYEAHCTRAERHEFYTILDANIDLQGRLIRDLRSISRLDEIPFDGGGSPQIEIDWDMVKLREAAEEVLATQRGRTNKHSFVLDFEPAYIDFETDPDKIQSILHNFVSNAIKYSPEGEKYA